MSDAKVIDLSGIAFSSTVFPSPEDRALWENLTPAQRLAIIERDEQAGFESGIARNASVQEILVEVLAEAKK